MQVLHKCDVRHCCNPDHLFLGTNVENMHDRNQKRRQAYGIRHADAKLTDDLVREARRMYALGTWTYGKLSDYFNVADTVIRKAVVGETWKHVT